MHDIVYDEYMQIIIYSYFDPEKIVNATYRILPKISPLPSLTFKFLHRYVCLDYKPPSHQVDRLHII